MAACPSARCITYTGLAPFHDGKDSYWTDIAAAPASANQCTANTALATLAEYSARAGRGCVQPSAVGGLPAGAAARHIHTVHSDSASRGASAADCSLAGVPLPLSCEHCHWNSVGANPFMCT